MPESTRSGRATEVRLNQPGRPPPSPLRSRHGTSLYLLIELNRHGTDKVRRLVGR